MDPNETLRRLRELLGGDHSGWQSDTCATAANDPGSEARLTGEEFLYRLCEAEELFQALDQWMQRSGSLPDDWRQGVQGGVPD